MTHPFYSRDRTSERPSQIQPSGGSDSSDVRRRPSQRRLPLPGPGLLRDHSEQDFLVARVELGDHTPDRPLGPAQVLGAQGGRFHGLGKDARWPMLRSRRGSLVLSPGFGRDADTPVVVGRCSSLDACRRLQSGSGTLPSITAASSPGPAPGTNRARTGRDELVTGPTSRRSKYPPCRVSRPSTAYRRTRP